jgi:hypothetical protein
LNGNIKKYVHSFRTNGELVEAQKIREFFKKITYPIAFLDMEFYTPAIPKYKGKKPFELTPFLFSWLQANRKGEPAAQDYFFHEEDSNPEQLFLERLIGLAEKVARILVFDTGQETAALNSIVRHHPQYKKSVEQIKKKFIDLADIFTNMWYYHPRQKGSTSLKKIHQAIFARDIYEGMPVNSGMLASYGYDDYLNEPDLFKKQELKENLVAYCRADTQAVLELFDFLSTRAAGANDSNW